MSAELIALLGGRQMGRVRRDRRGRLSFVYEEDWRHASSAYPLSVSMPLAAAEHGHGVIDSFLWGLLPDNEYVLDRWAARFHVSARNAYALISHVGEDCAGAVQFVRPERVEACLIYDAETIDWLDEHEVAERLRLLRADQSAWRAPRDTGKFSLAGAQPKTALLHQGGRWGVPSGHTPTTHILKPPTRAFHGHAENEHFCLGLARRLGLPTASSRVMRFEDETAIVVERYDRRYTEQGVLRVHQEDVCQAMAVPPTRKYQNERGPGPRDIVELLRTHSGRPEEDVATFLDALIFNWLAAGTDAHAKNYSLLIGRGGRVRLAPLYDLASALPHEGMDFQKLELAMKIGRHYRLRDIRVRDWQRLSGEARLDWEFTLERLTGHAEKIPDEASALAKEVKSQGMEHEIVDRLCDGIVARANDCLRSVAETAQLGGREKGSEPINRV